MKQKNYFKAIHELWKDQSDQDSLFLQWQKYQQEILVKELVKTQDEEECDGSRELDAEEFIEFESKFTALKSSIRTSLGHIDRFWTELQRRKLFGSLMHQRSKEVMAE